MATHKKRLHVAVGVIVTVAVAVVLAAGYAVWFAYHSAHLANASLKSANSVSKDIPKLPQITTFDGCKNAPKSKLLETYPEQCVTATGKQFTGTAQPKYLVIKEWGVKIPYAGDDTFTYQLKAASNGSGIQVSSEQLAAKYGCANYGAGSITRLRGNEAADPNGDTAAQLQTTRPDIVTKLGNYYYLFVHDQAECSDIASSGYQSVANNTVKASLSNVGPIN